MSELPPIIEEAIQESLRRFADRGEVPHPFDAHADVNFRVGDAELTDQYGTEIAFRLVEVLPLEAHDLDALRSILDETREILEIMTRERDRIQRHHDKLVLALHQAEENLR